MKIKKKNNHPLCTMWCSRFLWAETWFMHIHRKYLGETCDKGPETGFDEQKLFHAKRHKRVWKWGLRLRNHLFLNILVECGYHCAWWTLFWTSECGSCVFMCFYCTQCHRSGFQIHWMVVIGTLGLDGCCQMVDGWDTGSVCGDPLETFCHNMCYGMKTTNMCLIGILWCLNVSVGGVFAGTNEVRWQWCCMFVLSQPLTGGFGVIRSFECPRWYHSEPGDIICQITTWIWMRQCHASG